MCVSVCVVRVCVCVCVCVGGGCGCERACAAGAGSPGGHRHRGRGREHGVPGNLGRALWFTRPVIDTGESTRGPWQAQAEQGVDAPEERAENMEWTRAGRAEVA